MTEATPRRPGEQTEEAPVNPIAETDAVNVKESSPAPVASGPAEPHDLATVYEQGLQIEARSQWQLARRRFFRHKLAMASIVVLLIIFGAAIFAEKITSYDYAEQDFAAASIGPGPGPAYSRPELISGGNIPKSIFCIAFRWFGWMSSRSPLRRSRTNRQRNTFITCTQSPSCANGQRSA